VTTNAIDFLLFGLLILAAIVQVGAVLVMLRTVKKPLPRKSFRNALAIGLAATVTGAILYVVLGVRIGIIDFSGLPRGRLVSFYRNKGRLFEGKRKASRQIMG
jgi:hypothetical protein